MLPPRLLEAIGALVRTPRLPHHLLWQCTMVHHTHATRPVKAQPAHFGKLPHFLMKINTTTDAHFLCLNIAIVVIPAGAQSLQLTLTPYPFRINKQTQHIGRQGWGNLKYVERHPQEPVLDLPVITTLSFCLKNY